MTESTQSTFVSRDGGCHLPVTMAPRDASIVLVSLLKLQSKAMYYQALDNQAQSNTSAFFNFLHETHDGQLTVESRTDLRRTIEEALRIIQD